MDINQAAQMIEWLDEERRRDKSLIATLEERLAQQQSTIETFQRRINGVESDQTTMRELFVSADRENDLVERLRREMKELVESLESKRLNAEREIERRSEIAREAIKRPLQDLTDRINRLERHNTDLPAMSMEHDRTTTSIQSLQQRIDDLFKRLEDPDRRIAFLEEQRRQDVRRISETQSELPEIQKQIDSIKPKLTLLEELAIRTERRVQEVQNTESDRRDQIQQFIDQQTLVLQQRDQQIRTLTEKFGEQDSAMQRNIERFETWSETYRDMKKIIDDFERIGDRLERRINEVAEMQRLSEERFRQEWNDWSSDDQRRWKQFTTSNDEVWRSHDKEFERYVEQVTEMKTRFQPIVESLDRLWKLERERARLYRESYQTMLLEHDTGTSLAATTPLSSTSTPAASTPPTSGNGGNGTEGNGSPSSLS